MNLVGRIQQLFIILKEKYYYYFFLVLTKATGCLTLGLSVLVDTAVTVPVPLVLAPVSIGSISVQIKSLSVQIRLCYQYL